MATTTNYGWTTPDDTALVKDGASAIRTLGSSVDTTTKALNPSTTLGDIEYRSSTPNTNTRLPLGTAGQVLKVNSGATAPEWATDATGMTNPMTTTGDTIYSSSGSTPARLAIGSTGNVLTVAGGVPTWAAPTASAATWTNLVNGTALSGSSMSFTGLSGYNKFLILIRYASCNTASVVFNVNFNSDTAANYKNFEGRFTPPSTYGLSIQNNDADTGATRIGYAAWASGTSSNVSGYLLLDGANSTGVKSYTYASGIDNSGGQNGSSKTGGGVYIGTSVISSIQLAPASGSFSGGNAYIYGGN